MLVASNETENVYLIPVTWQAKKTFSVRARSLREACEYIEDNLVDLSLDDNEEVDGSLEIIYDKAKEHV